MKLQKIAVLGSTGSIGNATLEVIAHLPQRLKLVAIAAHHTVDKICIQAQRYRPKYVALTDPTAGEAVKKRLGKKFIVLAGIDALSNIVAEEVDTVVMAMSGTIGIKAVIDAIKAGKTVALATKEILVSFGTIVTSIAKKYNARILPIDSELAALHQCLNGRKPQSVRRMILTASGGPFWRTGLPENARLKTVLRHPVWKMGPKITVDSATMMNKGLEVIETVRLFGVRPEQVTTVIHPESIVHSLVEFEDGSIIAQLSHPDMRLPIQYCLTFPERTPSLVKPLRLEEIHCLRFLPTDFSRFPCLKLAYQALEYSPTGPCVLNAANEVAVNAFLTNKIALGTIPAIIAKTLKKHIELKKDDWVTLVKLQRVEKWATAYARAIVEKKRE
ncbi:MAG: 1-deoxy-D-xylulose-5-phosphate reductoisomerase [bacterium]